MSNRKTQKIVHHEMIDGEEVKKIIVPKIINTDVHFQLVFGMDNPGRITHRFQQFKREVYMDEIKSNR